MSTLEILNSYVDMLIVATLIAFVLIAAATYYMLKVKKVTAKEERINYDTFSRRDAKEFVKFDNVLSCSTGNEDSSFGIVVVNKNTFLGALDVTGYNFNTASDEERVRTMINSVSFFNLVEKPIQLRQTVKAIEIDYNIGKQLEVCKELARKSMDLEAEYEDTYALSEQVQDNPEVYEAIAERLDVLQNMIVSVRWQASEANAVLQLMKGFTAGGQAKKVNQLIFSYTYNASDYTQELSDEEIYMKACSELALMANNYASALANCGCTCKLLSGKEYLDLIRRHYHPYTADEIRIEDMFNSSYQALFISSDAILRAEKKRVGEKAFQKKLEEYRAMADSRRQIYETELAEFAEKLTSSVENYVSSDMQMEESI